MASYGQVDYDQLKRAVFDLVGVKPTCIDLVWRDESRKSFEVTLEDGRAVLCNLLGANMPSYIFDSEVATMRYLRDHTAIPVVRVLAYETDPVHPLGPHILLEKVLGASLDVVLPRLTLDQQDAIVAQIARWTVKLFMHRFNAIGSLYSDSQGDYLVGPTVRKPFFIDGRSKLRLDRGPFSSAMDYLFACTQRELDCARMLIAQDASQDYQRDLEECRLQVEQSTMMLSDLIRRCKGLDHDDADLAPFSLDFHELGLKNFLTAEDDPTTIVAITGLDCICTKPLWQCARLPRWLVPSLSDEDDGTKVRLAAIFRHVVSTEDSSDGLFLRALNSESEDSTRCSLHDLCDYDAFKDGFLLRPALESIAATLPGEEDVDGLARILDPSTVAGRVARISLMTRGFAGDALSLAFSQFPKGGGHHFAEDKDEAPPRPHSNEQDPGEVARVL